MVKIYGLFRYTASGAPKIWVLIMGNTFPPGVRIDSVFDLKGRPPKPGKSVNERGVVSQKVLKDNEILRKFLFHAQDKEFYVKQLQLDVNVRFFFPGVLTSSSFVVTTSWTIRY